MASALAFLLVRVARATRTVYRNTVMYSHTSCMQGGLSPKKVLGPCQIQPCPALSSPAFNYCYRAPTKRQKPPSIIATDRAGQGWPCSRALKQQSFWTAGSRPKLASTFQTCWHVSNVLALFRSTFETCWHV